MRFACVNAILRTPNDRTLRRPAPTRHELPRTSGPPRPTRTAKRLHLPGSISALRAAVHALVDRQGLDRLAVAGAQGVLRPRPVSARAHRHQLQAARDDRVPRPAGDGVPPADGGGREPRGAGSEDHLPGHAAPAGGRSQQSLTRRLLPAAQEGRPGRHADRDAAAQALEPDHRAVRARPRSRALPRRHRGRARRRRGQPFQGALLLAARQEQRVGRRRSAARVLEPVQDRLRARHARAHPSAAGLDRAEHLGIHQAREHPDGLAVLRPGRRQALPQPRLRALPAADRQPRRATSTTSWSSSRAASCGTSPSARDVCRTANTVWKSCAAKVTCDDPRRPR